MSDHFWFFVAGIVVFTILASAWRFERNSTSYQKYLKRTEEQQIRANEQQDRADTLLARQEQLLERIESLVERVVQKFSDGGEKAPAKSAIKTGEWDQRS